MKTIKIGLLDHMGYGNLGDAATQEALIVNIQKRIPEAEIIGFSLNPDDTRKRHNIVSYSITSWHPGLRKGDQNATNDQLHLWSQIKSFAKNIPVISKISKRALLLIDEIGHLARSFKVLRSLDSLIIAGGGQLAELWRGPWSHPYNVFKFSLLAKLANRKLLFLNVGAGPLESGLSKAFVKYSIHLADYVSFRDVESQALVERLGVRRNTYVFPDSAYALDLSKYERDNVEKSPRPVVGINPIGFCDPRIWPRQNESAYLRYLDNLAAFSLWLIRHNYRLKVFSGEASVDIHALDDLKERLERSESRAIIDDIFIPPSRDVEDLLFEMSGFDFIITSKFHGVIFSHLLEKPVIALSYHNKIDDLMRLAGHSQYCLSIESFTSESLEEGFRALVNDGNNLKSRFRQRAYSNSEILGAQFDALFVPPNLQLCSRS